MTEIPPVRGGTKPETPWEAWGGDFGQAYTDRHPPTPAALASRARLWEEILSHLEGKPYNTLEVGANIGLNLMALKQCGLDNLAGLEPNKAARAGLAVNFPAIDGTAQFIAATDGAFDLVFTSGVLIHIPPHEVERACQEIHRVANRWIVAIEYFSAEPREVPYRDRRGMLWTQDFGGLYMRLFPDVEPIACGFCWKELTGLDNVTWWVFRK